MKFGNTFDEQGRNLSEFVRKVNLVILFAYLTFSVFLYLNVINHIKLSNIHKSIMLEVVKSYSICCDVLMIVVLIFPCLKESSLC